ncbi:MAG TPA: hypothetical protein VKH19_05995 [Gemmatimonadaceae bacterium]|nr:hypothetical protein [Gemmatimonadaceae bacterium]
MGTSLPTSSPSRRWIGRLARIGLVIVALVFIGTWFGRKASRKMPNVRVQRAEVTDQAMGPGDLRIYNGDSSVDVVLHGAQVLAGLSPQTAAKVRADMAKDADKDSTGLGGFIAQTVKQTVASAITTHIVYPVSDIADLRYEDGQIIIERRNGDETRLFGDARVNGREQGKTFREADAQRFIDAVRARKAEIERGSRRF